MLSDNIRNYRKKFNLSQDELAEKVGVSRQSVSFWETGQTQPTIENIIALTKIFNISSDTLLGNSENANIPQNKTPKSSINKKTLIIAISIVTAVAVGVVILAVSQMNNNYPKNIPANVTESSSDAQSEISSEYPSSSEENSSDIASQPPVNESIASNSEADIPFDLFSYCKNFAIQKGNLNGDYCIYQQPATKYGGYDNEYFSISYWGDSNMVEFCLHCPLSETQSHNFYLRMRGGYNKKYEYLSSKYYRSNGESIRSAMGYIDPTVFSDRYPISCDDYQGKFDGQTEFMEESRVGICDLIYCLKNFVTVENMECDFSDFDFVNF